MAAVPPWWSERRRRVGTSRRPGGWSSRLEQAGRVSASVLRAVDGAGDLERLVNGAVERWGRVDVLVNSAGHGPKGPVLEISDDDPRALSRERAELLAQGTGRRRREKLKDALIGILRERHDPETWESILAEAQARSEREGL